MIKLTIKPFDVLFFGSGKPFNMGDVAESVFPPHPTTFAGAVCSKIYTHKNKDVSNILNAVYGPFVEYKGELLLPKPCNLYGERKKDSGNRFFILKPQNDGDFRIFKYKNTNKPNIEMLPIYKGSEEIEGFRGFINLKGLKELLKGNPNTLNRDIVGNASIFKYDGRVGIKMDRNLNSVGGEENAMYRVKYLELNDDCSFAFWVDFKDKNDEGFLYNTPMVLKLGGEMRSVRYKAENCDFREFLLKELGLDEKLDLKREDRVMFLFLSYGVFEGDNFVPKIEGFKVISMCVDGYSILGINSKNKGRKTVKSLPPGAVIWAECEEDISIETLGFLVKDGNGYKVKDMAGDQEFIGTNLVLVVKGG